MREVTGVSMKEPGRELMTFSVHCDQGDYGGVLDMSISISRDSNIYEIMDVFERMVLALTYTKDTFEKAIIEKADEIVSDRELMKRTKERHITRRLDDEDDEDA